MTDTVRSHLEWLQTNPWAQPEYIAAHAVAALALMDEAAYTCADINGEERFGMRWLLVPDSDPGSSLPGAPTNEETL